MIEEDRAISLIKEIEKASQRSRPYLAISVTVLMAAFIFSIVLTEVQISRAEEVNQLARETRAKQSELQATLLRLEQRPSRELANQALSQARQIEFSLAQ